MKKTSVLLISIIVLLIISFFVLLLMYVAISGYRDPDSHRDRISAAPNDTVKQYEGFAI